MNDDDRELSAWLRAGFAALRSPEPVGDPVDPNRVWAAAHGELGAEETAALVDRMAHDPDLAEEWRLALGASMDGLDEHESPTVIEPKIATWRRVAYVAAPLAAAAVLVLWMAPRGSGPSSGIGAQPPDDPGTYRGEPRPEPTWDVKRDASGLTWVPVEGATQYRVRVMSSDFEVLVETRTDSARVDLPDAVSGTTRLRWQIDALGREGTVVSRGSGELGTP